MRPTGDVVPGRPIVRASWAGTAVFALTAGLGAVWPHADGVALAVALAMFLVGCLLFGAALVKAAGRSRTEEIAVMALFLLDGAAPWGVRRSLLGAVAAEVAVAVVTAAVRPNTSLAFGILAPVYGLGLAGLWGSRHGSFHRRERGPI